jgi:hypothetical protein
MGNCNCKKDSKNNIENVTNDDSKNKQPLVIRGLVFISKLFIFLFASVLSVIIVIPFSIYMLYKVIFLNEGVDISGALLKLGKTFKKKENNDDEEFEFEDEDELELLEVIH